MFKKRTRKLPSPSGWARSLSWADLAVFPLVLVLSMLPLLWFGRNWMVDPDGSRYLLLGQNLISGEGYTIFGESIYTVRGMVMPELLGGLMLLLGSDVEVLAWAVRLLALANPVLMYFLLKRIAGPPVGLLAAALVALFGYTATFERAFNVDAVQLAVYLLALLTLLSGIRREVSWLCFMSGLLLGAAALTKETSLAALPLALFTALLLGRGFLRGALLHYAGVAIICLPWWALVWALSGQTTEDGRSGTVVTVMAALAVAVALLSTALLAAGSRWSGRVARLLADERWRLGIGWFVVLAPVAAISALFLASGAVDGSDATRTTLGYVGAQLVREINLWYLLPLAGAYVLWETLRGDRLWGFYLALLVSLIPASLFVLQEQWATRQWTIPQALLYGALAGLIVKLLEAFPREGGRDRRRWLAVGAGAALAAVLALAAVAQVRYLSDDAYVTDADGDVFRVPDYHINEFNPAVLDMQDWISANLPEGEPIITTQHYSKPLVFLDDARHEWETLQAANCEMTPRPDRCWPGDESPAVWFEMDAGCDFRTLPVGGLGQQLQRSGSTYILATQEEQIRYPANLAQAPFLKDGAAFETVHQSYLPDARGVESSYGLVLLRWTGEEPASAPTQMSAESVKALISCERTLRGEGGYAGRLRGAFPNGIEVVGSRLEAESARRAVENIYALRPSG